jgi:hypothetical protein
MKKKQSIQYTLREVPEDLDSRLREAAAMEETSLNQATLRALERGLGVDGRPVRYRNLRPLLHPTDRLDRRGWQAALAEQDQVDLKDWR